MNLQQIEYIMTVAEERSFSKASKRLFITQPSLSQVISKVEKSLGTQLFDRSTNPLQITQAGNVFIKHAKEIIKADEMLRKEISELSEMKKGILKIGINQSYATCLLVPSINEFSKIYSDIEIKVYETSCQELEKMLTEGDIDFAITSGKFRSDIFRSEYLTTNKMYVAVSENKSVNRRLSEYRLFADDIKNDEKDFKSIDIAEFRNEKMMFLHNETLVSETLGFTPEISAYADSIETLFSFVLSGIGVALIPEMFIKFSNVQYHPVYYHINGISDNVMLVTKHNRNMSKPARIYKDIVMDMYK